MCIYRAYLGISQRHHGRRRDDEITYALIPPKLISVGIVHVVEGKRFTIVAHLGVPSGRLQTRPQSFEVCTVAGKKGDKVAQQIVGSRGR